MTRIEYRKAVKETVKNGWEYYSEHFNFPELLKTVAVELFMRGDCDSELSVETRRRLNQLHDTGITDE